MVNTAKALPQGNPNTNSGVNVTDCTDRLLTGANNLTCKNMLGTMAHSRKTSSLRLNID
jgi:hypothetical protein